MEAPSLDASEIDAVFGSPATECSVETLVHNTKNAVTQGVHRIRMGDASAILKVLSATKKAASSDWSSSGDAAHWNYWRREALVYESDLLPVLGEAGLGSPRLLGRFERSRSEIALWLEDIEGRRGDSFDLEDHVAAARALGRAQGSIDSSLSQLRFAGLSRGFLRSYSDKPVDWSLLDDDSVWALPLVAESLGPAVRDAGRKLFAERVWLLQVMEALPQTVCHLDFWPMNLIRRPGGELVALDWSFVGDGALGEDLGNHISDTAFSLFVQPSELCELDRQTFSAFIEGLREGGWTGEERSARLGVCASAVKYTWLLPLMLARAAAGDHASYGGAALADPSDQYRRRGETLIFLASWVDEARALSR